MPKKKTILSDSFEQVAELGKTTAKRTLKTAKNIALDVGTAKALEQLVTENGSATPEKTNGKNHTPLKMDELQNKYKEQDVQKEAALRARLFQLSRQEEGKILSEKKQEKQQEEQQIVQEEQQKKRKEEEKMQQQEQGALPEGKKRRSIFSPKKKASEQHAETRPATGKQ